MSENNEKTGIDLYTWSTPNGRKVSIMLEECQMPYRVIPIDITRGDQHTAEYTAISPNNKIPAIVDHDTGITLMESGAILMYLARKCDKLLAPVGDKYWEQMEWLMFQMGHIGPMLGQTHHFVKFNPGKAPYAEERYQKENRRLYQVLEDRLDRREYICDQYSIVDIATWPWISRFEYQQMDLLDYPALYDWYMRLSVRPPVIRGYQVPEKLDVPVPQEEY